jgi:hypothetical protein
VVAVIWLLVVPSIAAAELMIAKVDRTVVRVAVLGADASASLLVEIGTTVIVVTVVVVEVVMVV